MTLHDWTNVVPDLFQDFRASWVCDLSRSLNRELEERGHYCLLEPIAAGLHQTILDAEDFERIDAKLNHIDEAQREVTDSTEDNSAFFAMRANRIAIFDATSDHVVGFVEAATAGETKNSTLRTQFVNRVELAIDEGLFVLAIDLFPYEAFREPSHGEDSSPICQLGAYVSDSEWIGAVSVGASWTKSCAAHFSFGEPLPEIPLFFATDKHIEVQLQGGYENAWNGFPQYWREILESESDG